MWLLGASLLPTRKPKCEQQAQTEWARRTWRWFVEVVIMDSLLVVFGPCFVEFFIRMAK